MDSHTKIERDPFLAALRRLPSTHLLPPNIAEALLHLPPQTLDVRRARGEPVPPITAIAGQRGYTSGNLLQYAEQAPSQRGLLRIHHASFPEFLTYGRPDDVWTFGMVLLDFHGQRRPIDVLTCIELTTDQLWSASCQQMTLAEYVAFMDDYLSRFEDQRIAEALAAERAQLAARHAPPAPIHTDKALRRSSEKTTRHRS